MVKDWGGKRYNNLGITFLRNKFGRKYWRFHLMGDFSCPNRDRDSSAKVDVYSVVRGDQETLQGIGTFLLRSNL